MKSKTLQKISIIILALLMAIAAIYGCYNFNLFNALADNSVVNVSFTGLEGSPTDHTLLFNATNTYTYNGDNKNDNREYQYFDTSETSRNDNTVMDGAPQITVLTHGLGGGASHWSNDGADNFAYDEESLPARLNEELVKLDGKGANIYWARMQNADEFKLYDLSTLPEGKSIYNVSEMDTITSISDISKHIIILFDSSNTSKGNYNYIVYEEFNYMLSKIVYDVKNLNGGVLPKINLIGHSRGGLTNLQYALDHPEMIDSMFGIGTPYFGSDTASTDLGRSIFPDSVGIDDIVDRNIYLNYYNRWNENYDRLYSNINAHALGGYSDTDFLFDALIASDFDKIEEKVSDEALTAGKWAIKSLPALVRFFDSTAEITDFITSFLRNEDYDESDLESWIQIIADIQYVTSDDSQGFWENLWDNFVHNIPVIGCPYFMNDLLVDLSSQIGHDAHSDSSHFYNFKVYTKCFREDDYNSDADKKLSSTSMPKIVHNLEARDTDFINYILSNISLGAQEDTFLYTKTSATTASLYGYRGSNLSGSVALPSQIDGLTVNRVSPDLFKTNGTDITALSIPSTVETIDRNAFVGLTALQDVEFSSTSNVTTIGSGAFANCTLLENFEIPASVTSIAPDAFLGCTDLSEITVAEGNTSYSASDGVLFNTDKTILIAYPAGKGETSYTVPASVTEISSFAFNGNNTLTTINLNNVNVVRQYAFNNCTNLSTINTALLDFSEIGAFDETAWLKAQTDDIIILGNVLLKYQGNEANISIENVTSIAASAFYGNSTLISVTINEGVLNIGEGAFAGCYNLETVNICNKNAMVYVSDNSFFDNSEGRHIYVPYPLLENYLDDTLWQQYEADITSHETNITFDHNGGTGNTSGSVHYQDYLDLPDSTRDGYYLEGWYDNEALEGDPLNEQTPWDSMDETVTFYAKWKPLEYLITYHTNGGYLNETTEIYTVENAVTYAIPTKTGFTFAGWYYDAGLTQYAGTGFSAGEIGDKVLYAKWSGNTYTIELDLNDDAKDPASASSTTASVIFNQNFTLPTATRNGYIFNGWATADGELYTLENGSSLKPWDIAQDTMLYANWTRKQFYVKVNANGTISWLGTDGFSDDQTPIEYGSEFMTATEIEQAFNPEKISYKDGHKFTYFTLEDGTKFTSWTEVPDLGPDGTIICIYANYTPEINFNIMFRISQGELLTADYGESISLIPAPDRIGYTFKYWMVADVNVAPNNSIYVGTHLAPGTAFNYTVMPDLSIGVEEDGRSIVLDAYYEPNIYNVSFETEYVEPPTTMSVVYDSTPTLPVLETPGRTFLGWYTEEDGNGDQITNDEGTLTSERWNIASDCTLYAAWDTEDYTITYYLNGGQYADGESNPTSYTIDTETFELVDPVRDGYRFMGWYPDSDFSEDRVYSIPQGSYEDQSLYAQWNKLYLLQFSEDGYISSYRNIEGIYGETVSLPNLSNKGYTWDGYEMGDSYIITGNRTFYLTEKSMSEVYNSSSGYYEIWTYNQLNSIRNYRSSKHMLMTPITIPTTSSWTPIPRFTGTFDGNGYAINDLIISYGLSSPTTTVSRSTYGLFEENAGTIKNLTLSQAEIALYTYYATYSNVPVYGGLIAAKNTGTISYCNVYGSFFQFAAVVAEIESYSGAICGYNTGCVEYCEVFETGVQLTTGYGGGIAGHNKGGTIIHCNVGLSTVSCYQEFRNDTEDGYTADHYAAAGGIVGYAEGGTISYCDVAGDVDVAYNGFSSESRSLAPELGIIAGRSTNATTYIANVADGEISAINGLKVITWKTGWWLWEETHTWDQAQYAKGNNVGRYV